MASNVNLLANKIFLSSLTRFLLLSAQQLGVHQLGNLVASPHTSRRITGASSAAVEMRFSLLIINSFQSFSRGKSSVKVTMNA